MPAAPNEYQVKPVRVTHVKALAKKLFPKNFTALPAN